MLLVLVFALFKRGVTPLNDQEELITCSLAFAVCMSAYWAIKKIEKQHHVFTGSSHQKYQNAVLVGWYRRC